MTARAGLLVALLGLAQAGSGQDPSAFDRDWERFEAGADAAAAARALDAFLRWPDGPARTARLERAVVLAGAVRDHRLLQQLADEARRRAAAADAPLADLVVHAQLAGLARAGRAVDFAALARADLDAGRARAVLTALRDAEAQLLPLADELLRDGRTAPGRWLFEQLAALPPTQPYRLANLGLALRNLGELDAAATAYRRALELAPGDREVWNDYGLLLRAAGRPTEAVAAFRRSYDADAEPGAGPAVTNLVVTAVLADPAAPAPADDPLALAASALRRRPDAALLRRATLDLLLLRHGAEQRPDNRASARYPGPPE
ncbi:MAG: tetratricopeptide repeat protein [Planctomycetota bacterium]